MFRLFEKINSREEQEQLIFKLSDSIEVTLQPEDSPYYSRLYLLKNGAAIANASISYEDMQKIRNYYNQTQHTQHTNETFLTKLAQLKLDNFIHILNEQKAEARDNLGYSS
ncbi:hypothetical protein [Legionella clemsonensis]|uniref:Uncharacterized protein n=1 Tax=Legionella clemsonensis TaxID=1867846 RepID=A0A222P648_9GAMM|nr:hypothetical protein [Legionella clemsonensis]ASQ47318.1 hypothetical protein clem_13960 [Legionella clemsonensis]